jgi:predicted dehydrogenase
MNGDEIRVGIIGLGGNCRLRHVPGLRACSGVEITAVCNRRLDSTAAAAREFAIPRTFERWQELVHDDSIDAILIGTWPYLHAPITRAALQAGKHVLTEARMAMTAAEARSMVEASRARPDLITQIVPSPFGLRAHNVLKQLLTSGYIGQLREVVVIGTSDALADPSVPLGWRQVAELSGVNMLTLGILHETLIRWVPDPVRVYAQGAAFTPERMDPATGMRCAVGTPDSVQVLTEIAGGARGIYHFSGVTRFGPGSKIHLYGSEGTLKYELLPQDRLFGARRGDSDLREIDVPTDQQLSWRVEADFIDAIRGGKPIQFTDFASGLRYMEFTESVARSAESGLPVDLRGEEMDEG